MQASDLRAIAERAAQRNYMRARVSSVYGWDEYGVTVPGREHEARVRTLSRSFHQVGDTVVLASINGDAQLLVIIDAVGQGSGSPDSPYPPFPPALAYIWPMWGHDAGRSYTSDQTMITTLQDDPTWWALMQARGARLPWSQLFAAADRWIMVTDDGDYAHPSTVRALSLDATSTIWTYSFPSLVTQATAGQAIIAVGQIYLHGTYQVETSPLVYEQREGIIALDLSTGAVRWGTGETAPRADVGGLLPSGNLMAIERPSDYSDIVDTIYELAAGNGDVLATITAADLLSSDWRILQADTVLGDSLLCRLEAVTPPLRPRIVALRTSGAIGWAVDVDALSSSGQVDEAAIRRATSSLASVAYRHGATSEHQIQTIGLAQITTSGSVAQTREYSGNTSNLALWYDPVWYTPNWAYRWLLGGDATGTYLPVHGGKMLEVTREVAPLVTATQTVGGVIYPGVRRTVAGGMGYHSIRLLDVDLSVLWEASISYPSRQPVYQYGYTPDVIAIMVADGRDPSPYWSPRPPDEIFTPPNILLATAIPRDVDYTATPDPYEILPGGQRAWSQDVEITCTVAVGSESSLLFTSRGGVLTTPGDAQVWHVTDDGLQLLDTVGGRPVPGRDAITYQGSIYYTSETTTSVEDQQFRRWSATS